MERNIPATLGTTSWPLVNCRHTIESPILDTLAHASSVCPSASPRPLGTGASASAENTTTRTTRGLWEADELLDRA